MHASENFIDGKISPTKTYLTVMDRFKDSPTWKIADSEVLDLIKSIQPAQKAFKEWKSSNIEDRLKLVEQFQTAVRTHHIELVEATAKDHSLPITFIERVEYKIAQEKMVQLKQELLQVSIASKDPIGPIAFVLSAQFPLRQFMLLVFFSCNG